MGTVWTIRKGPWFDPIKASDSMGIAVAQSHPGPILNHRIPIIILDSWDLKSIEPTAGVVWTDPQKIGLEEQ